MILDLLIFCILLSFDSRLMFRKGVPSSICLAFNESECSVNVLVTQSCLILCSPVDCSPPDSPVHRVLQAKILELVNIPFSRPGSAVGAKATVSALMGPPAWWGGQRC